MRIACYILSVASFDVLFFFDENTKKNIYARMLLIRFYFSKHAFVFIEVSNGARNMVCNVYMHGFIHFSFVRFNLFPHFFFARSFSFTPSLFRGLNLTWIIIIICFLVWINHNGFKFYQSPNWNLLLYCSIFNARTNIFFFITNCGTAMHLHMLN